MFESVLEAVRKELDGLAEDPDMIELFDFLVGKGVGTNSYIDNLLDFTGIFVDSKSGGCACLRSELRTPFHQKLLGFKSLY